MSRSTPWWVLAVGVSFLAYFGLLAYCDIVRPEDYGLHAEFSGGRMRIARVISGSPADRAGVLAGDVVVHAGQTPIREVSDWTVVSSHIHLGQPEPVTIVRDGRTFQTALTLQPRGLAFWLTAPGSFLLMTLTIQLVSIGLAWVIVVKKPDDGVARLGAFLLAAIGVFKIALPYRFAAVWNAVPLPLSLLFWIPHTSDLACAAVLASFAASFPRRLIRSPWLWLALWTPMLASIVPATLQWLAVLNHPESPVDLPFYGRYQTTLTGGYLAAALIALMVNFRRTVDLNERRRIKVLVFGAVGGLVPGFPVVAAYWLRSQDNLAESIFASGWTTIGTISFLLFPASFIYAILWHHLFDIRVIIRRGVQYALARRGLIWLAPALILLLVADVMAQRNAPLETVARSRGWAYLTVGIGIVVANSNRQRWLDSLDRRFFREQYNAQRILKSVAEDIRATGDFEIVAPRVVAQIDAALHPRFVALVARDSDELSYRVVSSVPAELDLPGIRADSKFVSLVRVLGRPMNLSAGGTAWLAAQLPPGEMASFLSSGVELVVPMSPSPAPREAALLLGLKRSEEPYSDEDCDLIALIANSLEVLMTRQMAAVPPPIDAQFEECPACGTCFEAGTGTCAADATALTLVPSARILAARYRLEKRLGQGGLGTVYEARDTALDRVVAIKIIRHDIVGPGDLTRRFQLEAKIAAAFVHPNVVTVHDFGTSGAQAFLVMERLAGATLRGFLNHTGRPATRQTAAVIRQVCAALSAAHEARIIHRDLKPENIFLLEGNPDCGVKVLDFGIAKLLSGTQPVHRTTAGVLMGTLAYMAPELLRGEESTPACDLWALALVGHEMLTGAHPFALYGAGLPGADAPGAGASLGTEARHFFSRALAMEPKARYQSAPAFLTAFERMLESTDRPTS
jgi:eukaryotic-like serine/threonine-protein kinase